VTTRSGFTLRVALGLLALAAPVVPRSRRGTWRRQWEADLRHQWAFLASQPGARFRRFDLLLRARGAFVHALVLRLRSLSMPTFLHDLRYGARMLTKRPGFTAVAVLLLGLGIGANGTIFSWTEGLLFRPISGAAHAASLLSLHGTTPTRDALSVSYPNFVDLRDRRPASVAGMTALRFIAVNIQTDGVPERAWAELVTADFFEVLGVTPAAGRVLTRDDDRATGGSPVVVLSHGYWQRRFDGSPAVVGRTINVNGTPFTVVGVAAPEFQGATTGMALDMWVPMSMQPAVYAGTDRLTQRGNSWLGVLVRPAEGSDISTVQAGLSRVAAQLAEEHPDVNEDRGVVLYPLWRDPQSAAAILGPVFGLLMAVTAVVLLIVCANLASLLLARGSSRRREIAVRLALGASRTRIVRQLLTESVLLAVLGGAAGLLFTLVTSRLLGAFIPPSPLPIDASVDLSLRVPLISFALALGTTVLFGLAPALQSSRPALVPTLKEARGMVGGGRRWLRGGLVAGQVALSVLLLVGAGLFVRTFQQARVADPGFDLEQGWLASLDLLPGGYDAERGRLLYRQLLQDVRALPGVESAAIGRDLPLIVGGSGSDTSVEIEGYVPAQGEEITIFYDRISPGFFGTLGVPLLAGRDFTDADAGDAQPVIVINRTMARRYWPDQDPVGGRVRIGDWATVVGVVDDMAYRGIGTPARPYMYLPLYSYYRPDVTLIVRTAADPGPVYEPLRAAVQARDANLPLFDVRTVAAHKDMSVFVPRLAALMLGLFGGLALLLAGVGLYGLLAFIVTERTAEIGVRLALGASSSGIVRLVVGQGLRLTALGGIIGVTLAAVLMPLAASQLVGVGAHDALTYATAVAVLLGGAMLASYLPARRAAAVDPIRALRHE